MKRQTIKSKLVLCACALTVSTVCQAQTPPDECSWEFKGSARKAVKLRTAEDGRDYTHHGGDVPSTVNQWFNLACTFDPRVPSRVPATTPMQGIETVRVIVRGFLVGARFERDDDHDIHAELAAAPEWESPHLIFEVPPGMAYCQARQALWDIVRADGCRVDRCILRRPVEIKVMGYVFLDSAHGSVDYCNSNGGRGIRKQGQGSQVRGLWEIHPALSVELLNGPPVPSRPPSTGGGSMPERGRTTGNAATSAGPVIGNKRSKVYHLSDCPGYKQVTEANRVEFKSEREAQAAGFRKAGNCP